MAPANESTAPATRRTRKSIGAHTDVKRTIDKENATVDVSRSSSLAANRKKSRSKSMGPGGLDALKQGNGNRRASLAAPAKPPRSILKPTIYSVSEIPPLKRGIREPRKSGDTRDSNTTSNLSADDSRNGSRIALRTEEEQQAAAREREERDRRDARRKSLANRRVSFAAEATLHTFHDIEYMQDSTTSTDSSRRASSVSGADATVPKSPDNQKLNRRNSGLPPMNFNNRDDDTLTSTIYSSDSEPADAVEEIDDDDEEDEEESSSDSDDDGTMMTIETEDVTGTTMASDRSVDSDEESSTLDEVLRIAAQRAGTQRLDDGQSDGELDDGEEIIPSFGWVRKNNAPTSGQQPATSQSGSHNDGTDMDMDMDMTTAMGGILKPQATQIFEPGEDMSMDVTQAFGGILSRTKSNTSKPGSGVGSETATDEATMEFTTAIGGIQQSPHGSRYDSDANEEMSMEFTAAMGEVLAQQTGADTSFNKRRTVHQLRSVENEDATMDMTVGFGQILSKAAQGSGIPSNMEDTMGMDITATIGGIISGEDSNVPSLGKRIMKEELDKPNSPNRAIIAAADQGKSPRRKSRSARVSQAAPTDITETLGLSAFQGNSIRRSTGPQTKNVNNMGTTSRTPSPPKPATPQLHSEPSSVAQRTRSKSPKSATSQRHDTSMKPKPHDSSPSSAKSGRPRRSLFENDHKTGGRTPTVVLTPQTRRLSGLGADKSGLGSPQVAALFDRRGSIGDSANDFVPGHRAVAFEDPKTMAEQIDKERQAEEDKENQRKILEREAEGPREDQDATFNLREMIDSLSPKRNLKGRKSLHVGSAKGLLGKRPAELDDEDEESDYNDGVKRLKGHQGSPVRSVKLPQPPSKEQTTGRLTRTTRRSLDLGVAKSTPSFSSPIKGASATTPRNQSRFKQIGESQTVHNVNFHDSRAGDPQELDEVADEERIQLQDFLNMTSIRFMELTTTKRRHTVAPTSLQDGAAADQEDDMSLERCVVAGACTVPMLELYQHSCRELKNYIAEGRRMVKEIEAETFEDNPPLFREYMSAAPDVKALMDNQFKNVKTHARLLSKAMWYEWRMKLQDGLKEGLIKISEGMDSDVRALQERENLLGETLPSMVARYESLQEENENLSEVAQELADCDPAELEASREELTSLDADIEEKKRLIAELREKFDESTAAVEDLASKKQHLVQEIQKAENAREACRGWTGTEVNSLKARVDAIEREHGWAVTGLAGTSLSMAYRREIEIVFDTASFQPHQSNSRIDLWYIGDRQENHTASAQRTAEKTAEKEFFLQCIRDHIRGLPQSRTKILDLLNIVRNAWDKARLVSSFISKVNITFPTSVSKTSDSSVAVTTSLLLTPLQTRVEAILHLHGQSMAKGIDVGISAQAKVIYGEHFNVGKVGEFLATRVGDRVGANEEDWSKVMVDLQQRLIARGRKATAVA